MGFGVDQVAELFAENIRLAYRCEPDVTWTVPYMLLPDGSRGRPNGRYTLAQMGDADVVKYAAETPLGQAAAKLTQRQVGVDAWRAYRDQAARNLGRPVYGKGGLSRRMHRDLRRGRERDAAAV